jgi:hypothetical protein
MNKTIGEESKLVQALVPATRSSTTSGETAVDTLGFDNVCFSVSAGDGTFGGGTPETYAFKIIESDDTVVANGSDITGATVSITADNTIKKIQVNGLNTGSRKRYLFCRLTAAGSSPSLPCAVTAILGVSNGALNPVQSPDVTV